MPHHVTSGLNDDDAEAVRKWLEQNQFKHVASSGGTSAGFGDSRDIWEREGTLVRLTRHRSQWSYDLSRSDSTVWLDVDRVAGAMGCELTASVERVADLAVSTNDRVFGALCTALPHSR